MTLSLHPSRRLRNETDDKAWEISNLPAYKINNLYQNPNLAQRFAKSPFGNNKS